jgi:hypothetical protein
MIKVHAFKKKRKEKGKEKPSTWWPMEGSKLGGPWNVSSLLALGLFQVCGPWKESNV